MSELAQKRFWDSVFMKVVRWILLLPVGLFLLALAEGIILITFDGVASLELNKILLLCLFFGAGGIFFYLTTLIAGFAATAAAYIAPNVKVGTSLLGIIYVLSQGATVCRFASESDWSTVGIKVIFSIIVITIFFNAYAEDE